MRLVPSWQAVSDCTSDLVTEHLAKCNELERTIRESAVSVQVASIAKEAAQTKAEKAGHKLQAPQTGRHPGSVLWDPRGSVLWDP